MDVATADMLKDRIRDEVLSEAHEYFRIDIHRVLEIVERDLPPLEEAISRLLSGPG